MCTAAMLVSAAGISGLARAEPAGEAEYVTGVVQVTGASGAAHTLRKGDAVNEGDTLTTGAGASAQVRMRDGGMVAVRPDTRMKFDSFKFSGKQDGSEQYFVSLFKGGFRAITGLIGRLNKETYRITTPTATIGIRGTDHETIVVLPGTPLAATVAPGTYNKVNRGETSISNQQGVVFVLPNQMGYAAAGRAPELQPLNLNLFIVPPPPVSGRGKDGGVRDSAVVDSALLDPNFAMGPTLPVGVLFARIPITATYTLPPQFCVVRACSPVSVAF
jgi:hypothetical protein